MLDAFRDVETALVSLANAKVRRDKLADEFAAVDIAQLLYERGVETFLPVQDAERSLYAAHNVNATLPSLISLYKSLGGGWQTASMELSN